jgi:hypothetical protein
MVKSARNSGDINFRGRKTDTCEQHYTIRNFNERELKVFHQEAIDEAVHSHEKGQQND